MADENASKQAAPPPPPAPAPKPQAPRIEPKRMGFDPLRPFRYAKGFLFGTVGNGLDGIASTGRLGMWAGVGLGVLACISGGFSVGLLMMGAVGGLAVGSIVGGILGSVTGAFKGVNQAQRKEKYADELAVRADTRRPSRGPAPSGPRFNLRDAEERSDRISNFNFDRSQQQARENTQDYNTYWSGEPQRSATHWQDRVSAEPSHEHGRGGR